MRHVEGFHTPAGQAVDIQTHKIRFKRTEVGGNSALSLCIIVYSQAGS